MEFNLALLLIGIAFFAVGLVLLFKQLKSKKNNTESVKASVVRYHTEISHDVNNDTESTVYYPVMRYCVADKWYESKSDVGRGKEKYLIGEHVDILYDPKNPENFIIAGDNSSLIISVIAIVIGIALCILAFTSK